MQSRYTAKILDQISGVAIVHHVEPDGTVWGSQNRAVLKKVGDQWTPVFRFPFRPPRDFFEVTRLSARASRADRCNVFANSNGEVLGIRDCSVYALQEEGGLEELDRIQGDSVLVGSICEDENGWVYFGEYFRNSQRAPVRVYRAPPDLRSVEIAHEFPAGVLRHVHSIQRDPFDTDALWVTVGDEDGECYFYRTTDGLKALDRIGEGTQTWRAVRLLFTEDHITWLTDSHVDQNHACRMKRSNSELEVGQEIDCSSWYCTTTADGLHVAFTTVEKGPAIHRDESSVLVSENGFDWTEACCFKKDFWRPFSIFKYGIISCPSGVMNSNDFYISGEGLMGLDGSSLRIGIGKEE